jgi:hypothetical protein
MRCCHCCRHRLLADPCLEGEGAFYLVSMLGFCCFFGIKADPKALGVYLHVRKPLIAIFDRDQANLNDAFLAPPAIPTAPHVQVYRCACACERMHMCAIGAYLVYTCAGMHVCVCRCV